MLHFYVFALENTVFDCQTDEVEFKNCSLFDGLYKSLWIFFAFFFRHRVTTTHLAQSDSELSLLQGELVLVHRPRPDGRVLVTQESSGQTGLFHISVLQALERLS